MPITDKNRKKRFFSPKFYRHLPETNVIGNNSDQTHIYYNLQVQNNSSEFDANGNPNGIVKALPAFFSQNRVEAFLNKPNEYMATLSQFYLDSNSVPIQIVYPKVGKSYVAPFTSGFFTLQGFETIYEITLTMTWQTIGPVTNTANITIPVYWVPLYPGLIQPPQPIAINNITNEYFWNYGFDYFLDLVNNSINYAMTKLAADNGQTLSGDPYGTFPFFKYNPVTDRIDLYAPLKSFQTDMNGNNVNLTVGDPPVWKIFINEPLYQLVSGMQYLYNTNYQLLLIPSPDLANVELQLTINGAPKYYAIILSSESSIAVLWNPVVSIVVTSPHFDIVNQLNAIPVVSGLNPNPPVNNAATLNVLFELLLGRRVDPVISYAPLAQYRLTDVLGIQPITELQIRLFWKDSFGILHQLFIEQGSGFNMKILFRSASLNA